MSGEFAQDETWWIRYYFNIPLKLPFKKDKNLIFKISKKYRNFFKF